jgi:inosine-uridine nucleoside N-ribohydrolase
MATPVLIDTDMGIDDAIAIALALSSPQLELAGLASVGGNVSLDQATANIARLLAALNLKETPPVGRGLDQPNGLNNAHHVFGPDGLGESVLPVPPTTTPATTSSSTNAASPNTVPPSPSWPSDR